MEQLGTVFRAVCIGACVCGLGVGALLAVFLGFAGGGIITTIKDILGIGQRDEDELIDEAMSSIQQNRATLRNKRSQIVGDGGVPDFDAAVAKYSQSPGTSSEDTFSSQSVDDLGRNEGRLGSGRRFAEDSGGLRGKRFRRDDDYEIYDDAGDDFFGD